MKYVKTIIVAVVAFTAGCASPASRSIPTEHSAPAANPLSIGYSVARTVAQKHYGATATPSSVTARRALLITFERTRSWGELRYLFLKMPPPQNTRIVALQNAAGNYPDELPMPQEESAALFSDEAFKKLKEVGRSWYGDVFAPAHRGETEITKILLPIIARHCLTDRGDLGRNNEWKEAYYSIAPLLVFEHEFSLKVGATPREYPFSCSVFMDEIGAMICHTANGILYVD